MNLYLKSDAFCIALTAAGLDMTGQIKIIKAFDR